MPGKRSRLTFTFGFVAATLLAQDVRYELRFPNAAHHEAEVRATFSGVRTHTLEVVMSRASLGSSASPVSRRALKFLA